MIRRSLFILCAFITLNILLNLVMLPWIKPGKKGYQFTVPRAGTGFFHNRGLKFFDSDSKGFVSTNSEGFRNGKTEDYGNAVFIFGDSQVDLFSRNESLINSFLEKRFGTPFVNASCISFSGVQEYILLKKCAEEYGLKKAMIFIYAGNDMFQNSQESLYEPWMGDDGVITAPAKLKRDGPLWYFLLYSFLYSRNLQRKLARPDLWSDLMFGYQFRASRTDIETLKRRTGLLFERFAALAKEKGIKMRFFIIPALPEIDREITEDLRKEVFSSAAELDELKEHLAAARHFISSKLASLGLECIDLFDYLKIRSSGRYYDKSNFHVKSCFYEEISSENFWDF